jgi:hypothetical protein
VLQSKVVGIVQSGTNTLTVGAKRLTIPPRSPSVSEAACLPGLGAAITGFSNDNMRNAEAGLTDYDCVVQEERHEA